MDLTLKGVNNRFIIPTTPRTGIIEQEIYYGKNYVNNQWTKDSFRPGSGYAIIVVKSLRHKPPLQKTVRTDAQVLPIKPGNVLKKCKPQT